MVVGRIVVIGSLNKRVHFLDATSGKRLGARKVPSAISNAACSYGSEVYLGLDRVKDSFLALNLASGRVVWKKNLAYPARLDDNASSLSASEA